MNSTMRVHVAIAIVWIGLALVLALKIALLGNEEIALKKGRGADLKNRISLAHEVDQRKRQLDYEASAPALDEAIRGLGLPLQPPVKTASRE